MFVMGVQVGQEGKEGRWLMCLRAHGVKTWHDVTGGVKCCADGAKQLRISTHEWVDKFYSPRLTYTGWGRYWYRGKFRSRIRGFLTDELIVLFAVSHTMHT